MPALAELLLEAATRPVEGWDFSWLGSRLATRPLPWDFRSIVEGRVKQAASLLDMSTGGGEWLAALDRRPARTVATEGWEPNVFLADARLRPLGIAVVCSEDAHDNVDQNVDETRGRLPFRTGSFALVTNRHASFLASEVGRVLARGGTFLTQQVGNDYGDALDALDLQRPAAARAWTAAAAATQLRGAGLRSVAAREGTLVTEFADVGAFAWYLRAVPWAVPSFTIDAHRPALERLHRQLRHSAPLAVRLPAFFLEATK
jgi:SAM-dependent methyltransferase